MLQYLRTGDEAVLGDMSYQNHRHSAFLGVAQQPCGHFLYLGYRAGGGIYGFCVHSLNGIHYHQVGAHLLGFLNDVLQQSLGIDAAILSVPSESAGSHLDLFYAFLSGDVEGAKRRAVERNLQRKGGFSYAGFTSDKNQGAGHYSSSQQPVKFPVAQAHARFRARVNVL